MIWVVLCVLVFLSIAFLRMSKKHNAVNLLGEFAAAASLWLLYIFSSTETSGLDFIMELILAAFSTLMLVVFLIRYLHGAKKKRMLKSAAHPKQQTEAAHPAVQQPLNIDRMPGEPVSKATEDRMPGMPYDASQAQTAAGSESAAVSSEAGTEMKTSSKSRSAVLAGQVPKQNFQSNETVAVLKKIIDEFGLKLFDQPKKLIGIFGDYAGQNLADEKKLLGQCLDANIAKDLIDNRKKSAEKKDGVRQQCVERVASKTFMDRAVVDQAVGWICDSIGW